VHRRPVVVTVHDLMPVIVLRSPPDGWREGIRNRFLRPTLKALRLAQAYIVGTEWLKSELATWLGDDKRISVVPFGVDRAFFSEAPGARTRGRSDWRIPESAFVVLHVGSTVERKNVPLVIQTVARLRNEADAYLLQVGGRFTGDQEQQIERLGLRRYVRSLPAADETTLRRAYRAADVLLFPSLYEGFGYPVIEAFASGLPVVTSGAGGLKEVGGDASVVVEGRDPTAYVQALEALSDDPAHMELLIARGRVRARECGWACAAARTTSRAPRPTARPVAPLRQPPGTPTHARRARGTGLRQLSLWRFARGGGIGVGFRARTLRRCWPLRRWRRDGSART